MDKNSSVEIKKPFAYWAIVVFVLTIVFQAGILFATLNQQQEKIDALERRIRSVDAEVGGQQRAIDEIRFNLHVYFELQGVPYRKFGLDDRYFNPQLQTK